MCRVFLGNICHADGETVLKILKMASKHPEPIPKAKALVLWNKIRRHNKPTWVVNSIQFSLIFIGTCGNVLNKWMFPLSFGYIEGNNFRGIKVWKGQKGVPIIAHAACKTKWGSPANSGLLQALLSDPNASSTSFLLLAKLCLYSSIL